MEIDKFVYFNKLYSAYKEILTQKQRDILELYLAEDFSLGEISEELGISRQAVHDAIKRSEHILNDFEKKLGILQKEKQITDRIQKIIKIVNLENVNIDKETKQEILDICKELS